MVLATDMTKHSEMLKGAYAVNAVSTWYHSFPLFCADFGVFR